MANEYTARNPKYDFLGKPVLKKDLTEDTVIYYSNGLVINAKTGRPNKPKIEKLEYNYTDRGRLYFARVNEDGTYGSNKKFHGDGFSGYFAYGRIAYSREAIEKVLEIEETEVRRRDIAEFDQEIARLTKVRNKIQADLRLFQLKV